jgi:DNA polymerase III subunit delta'
MSLVLHEHTAAQIARFVAAPSHALLLVGPDGIGKTALAHQTMAQLLDLDETAYARHPYIKYITPEKNTISIEAVRDLQKFLQLKAVGDKPLRRAVIVEHSSALSTEAQNALLKLLEEPPEDTIIILTAASQRALLPTILSRVQLIALHPPEASALAAHFGAAKDAAEVQRAYFLSGGLPGLMHALLHSEEAHPLLAGVTQAKELLQLSLFERLALVDRLSKQKDEAAALLAALQRIAETGLNGATKKRDPKQLKQWHRVLKVTQSALQAMEYNANTKLLLTDVMLHL